MKRLAVLRPEPGNAATCAQIVAAGASALPLPLFAVEALAWTPPPAEQFDALFLTSANALRHGGAGLENYRKLPVFAVGAATAAAAEAAGFTVAATGPGDALGLAALAVTRGIGRALHLAGRERAQPVLPGVAATIPVYASEPLAVTAAELSDLAGSVALLHSPRAAARLAALVPVRADIRLAAISPAALAAAGPGWADSAVAGRPDDAALVAAALALTD